MAVKKVKENTKATEVEVNEEVLEDIEENSVEETQETEEVKDSVEVTETVEVEETSVETTEVEVDTEKAEVKESNKPEGSVKIRMRVDHKCTIAMECYNLKAGKTYTVPLNVKRILNNAGLLAPL